jgi:hypothetical protein
MAVGQLATVNPLCPPGYRHLLTMREANSHEEAWREVYSTFGGRKATSAIFIRGCFGPEGTGAASFRTPWKVRKYGWTAFLSEKDFPMEAR